MLHFRYFTRDATDIVRQMRWGGLERPDGFFSWIRITVENATCKEYRGTTVQNRVFSAVGFVCLLALHSDALVML